MGNSVKEAEKCSSTRVMQSCFSSFPRKKEIEKELQSLLTISKNRQNENSLNQSSSQYPDSNSSLGLDYEFSLTQQIHSLHETASSMGITDIPLPAVNESASSIKKILFVEGNEQKEDSGFDSILDSSILEEVDRIEAESQVVDDDQLFSLAESLNFS